MMIEKSQRHAHPRPYVGRFESIRFLLSVYIAIDLFFSCGPKSSVILAILVEQINNNTTTWEKSRRNTFLMGYLADRNEHWH